MTDPAPYRPSDNDARTPRWVYVFGIIVIVLVLGFVVTHLMSGGFSRHSMP